MARGQQARQARPTVLVEFDHSGRTYRVELEVLGSGPRKYPEAPHPEDFLSWDNVQVFRDVISGQAFYGSMSSFGPIRVVPQQDYSGSPGYQGHRDFAGRPSYHGQQDHPGPPGYTGSVTI